MRDIEAIEEGMEGPVITFIDLETHQNPAEIGAVIQV